MVRLRPRGVRVRNRRCGSLDLMSQWLTAEVVFGTKPSDALVVNEVERVPGEDISLPLSMVLAIEHRWGRRTLRRAVPVNAQSGP